MHKWLAFSLDYLFYILWSERALHFELKKKSKQSRNFESCSRLQSISSVVNWVSVKFAHELCMGWSWPLCVNLTLNTEGSGDANRSASLFSFPTLPLNLFSRSNFSPELILQFRQPHELCWIFLDKNTEWSKPERKREIHIIAYMWNLEKWYRLTYFQGRNRESDVRRDLWTWGREGWIGRLGPPGVK